MVEVFEIQRHASGREGQALDTQHRCAASQMQALGERGVGDDGRDLQFRVAQRDTEIVLENGEDIALPQVCFDDAATDLHRQVSLI